LDSSSDEEELSEEEEELLEDEDEGAWGIWRYPYGFMRG
jgi:hypothetical protein